MHHFKKILLVLIVLSLGIAAKLWIDFKNNPPDRDVKKEAQIQLQEVSNALHSFQADCGRYPTTEEGLGILVEPAANCKSWGPTPYLKKYPADPWGNRLFYQFEKPAHFHLMTLGADGHIGGVGLDMDIAIDE